MNNIKLIITHKDYLLLMDDTIGIAEQGEYVYSKLANTVRQLEYKHGADNDRPIIAHLPLNNAPTLEGVPLLPELPKQEDDVEQLIMKLIRKGAERYALHPSYLEEIATPLILHFKHTANTKYQSSPVKLPVGFEPELYPDEMPEGVLDKNYTGSWDFKIINNILQGRWIWE